MTHDRDIRDTDDQDAKPNYPTLSIDWDLYGEYLEESDLTQEEKREFIQTLWNIVVSCVDLGFGIHPMQQACGEGDELSELISQTMLSCEDNNQHSESASQTRHIPSAEQPTDSK